MFEMLKIDPDFIPCPAEEGDELFPNGIFVFNVTRMIEYIQESDEVILEEVMINDINHHFSSINESHLDTVDISRPIILAEIAPGRYNLIDGHHRLEKARRMGKESMQAYKMNVLQHVQFLTSKEAYQSYVEYWNNKLK